MIARLFRGHRRVESAPQVAQPSAGQLPRDRQASVAMLQGAIGGLAVFIPRAHPRCSNEKQDRKHY